MEDRIFTGDIGRDADNIGKSCDACDQERCDSCHLGDNYRERNGLYGFR